MSAREEIIRKSLHILHGIEQVTDYHPGERYYQQAYEQLDSLNEEKLQEAFAQIATIATDSINTAMEDVKKIERGIIIEEEAKERLEEAKEAIGLLGF
ncbi:MAG: hypothetical protein PHH16_04435 [Candidatus Gracilibacteria bacterium]|nr:hypothetical protein [Candidatus Gracilibacteria bacterium]